MMSYGNGYVLYNGGVKHSFIILIKNCSESRCLEHKEHWHFMSEQVRRQRPRESCESRIAYETDEN
jgi:hypothetical protein